MGDAKMTSPSGSFTTYTAAAAYSEATKAAAAAFAEVAKERDQLREDVERCAQVGWYGLVEAERKNAHQSAAAASALSEERWRAVARAEQAEARVAELEALLRESQDLFMEAGPFHALRPAIKAQWRRRARAHINALASALAPQAPPARREGEIP